jgi:hypothetical protein
MVRHLQEQMGPNEGWNLALQSDATGRMESR